MKISNNISILDAHGLNMQSILVKNNIRIPRTDFLKKHFDKKWEPVWKVHNELASKAESLYDHYPAEAEILLSEANISGKKPIEVKSQLESLIYDIELKTSDLNYTAQLWETAKNEIKSYAKRADTIKRAMDCFKENLEHNFPSSSLVSKLETTLETYTIKSDDPKEIIAFYQKSKEKLEDNYSKWLKQLDEIAETLRWEWITNLVTTLNGLEDAEDKLIIIRSASHVYYKEHETSFEEAVANKEEATIYSFFLPIRLAINATRIMNLTSAELREFTETWHFNETSSVEII